MTILKTIKDNHVNKQCTMDQMDFFDNLIDKIDQVTVLEKYIFSQSQYSFMRTSETIYYRVKMGGNILDINSNGELLAPINFLGKLKNSFESDGYNGMAIDGNQQSTYVLFELINFMYTSGRNHLNKDLFRIEKKDNVKTLKDLNNKLYLICDN